MSDGNAAMQATAPDRGLGPAEARRVLAGLVVFALVAVAGAWDFTVAYFEAVWQALVAALLTILGG
ncbi:MAG: hypothetical protein H0T69_12985 [Thermoleophilaceae bacterium]|nr:hypothetical protein [Thermoleophilaceae bacterium]